MYDPVIGNFEYAQTEVVAYPFVGQSWPDLTALVRKLPLDTDVAAVEYNNIIGLTPKQLADLQKMDEECGYAALRETYLQFPPPGHQPPHGFRTPARCEVYYDAVVSALEKNICFDLNTIGRTCPIPFDPLDSRK